MATTKLTIHQYEYLPGIYKSLMKNTIVVAWLYNGLLAVEMNKKVSAYNNCITIS